MCIVCDLPVLLTNNLVEVREVLYDLPRTRSFDTCGLINTAGDWNHPVVSTMDMDDGDRRVGSAVVEYFTVDEPGYHARCSENTPSLTHQRVAHIPAIGETRYEGPVWIYLESVLH